MKNKITTQGNIVFRQKGIKYINKAIVKIIFCILLSMLCGIIGGIIFFKFNKDYYDRVSNQLNKYDINTINVINSLNHSLVGISSYTKVDKELIQNNLTGIIYSEDGYIVTNYEGIKGSEKIYIRIPTTLDIIKEANIIGYNEEYDVCLLKINGSGYTKGNFKDDTLGISNGLKVISIGNSYGKVNSYTTYSGIINNINVINDKLFIQSDFFIDNIGGPICDIDGNIIGINSLKINRDFNKKSKGSLCISSEDIINIIYEIMESATLL